MTQLLTPDAAASKLNIKKHSFYRLVGSGVLPVIRLGKLIRVCPDRLEQFLSQLTNTTSTPSPHNLKYGVGDNEQ